MRKDDGIWRYFSDDDNLDWYNHKILWIMLKQDSSYIWWKHRKGLSTIIDVNYCKINPENNLTSATWEHSIKFCLTSGLKSKHHGKFLLVNEFAYTHFWLNVKQQVFKWKLEATLKLKRTQDTAYMRSPLTVYAIALFWLKKTT